MNTLSVVAVTVTNVTIRIIKVRKGGTKGARSRSRVRCALQATQDLNVTRNLINTGNIILYSIIPVLYHLLRIITRLSGYVIEAKFELDFVYNFL